MDTACTRGFTKILLNKIKIEKRRTRGKRRDVNSGGCGGDTSTSGMATHRKRKKRVTHM